MPWRYISQRRPFEKFERQQFYRFDRNLLVPCIPAQPSDALKRCAQDLFHKITHTRLLAGPESGHVEGLDLVLDHEVQQPFASVFYSRMNMQARLAVFLGELERFLGTARHNFRD